jgi:hypothetical protein
MKTIIKKLWLLIFFLGLGFYGCEEDDFLQKWPPNQISEGTFWNNEDDALKALAGCYNFPGGGHADAEMWSVRGIIHREGTSDNALPTPERIDELLINGQSTSTNPQAWYVWNNQYIQIAHCNYYIENIDKVDMDVAERDEMKAEARFIRACAYFYLCQYYGGVPLVTKVLTVDEANTISRSSKQEVVNFVLTELTEAAADLPDSRPQSEKGRAPKAAALAFKGRLQMAEGDWSGAAATYKSIIDLGVYQIAPFYRELFLDDGEDNSEIIFATQYLQDVIGSTAHYNFAPRMINGTSSIVPLQDLIDSYEMTDGQTIDASPLYDPANPFDNRDPRLSHSVYLPNYSVLGGQLFVTHPDSVDAPDRMPSYNWSGYCVRKFIDYPAHDGTEREYGGDIPIIRYAEVLLSYLESKLEAGDPITQALLDETINLVRGRETVNMPLVTETNPDLLRTILRRERRVEFAFEGFRMWDLYRWRIAHINLNRPIYGAKVCDDPGNCSYETDADGHYYIYTRGFRENVDYLWPIPQDEIDINPNLEQNPGY